MNDYLVVLKYEDGRTVAERCVPSKTDATAQVLLTEHGRERVTVYFAQITWMIQN